MRGVRAVKILVIILAVSLVLSAACLLSVGVWAALSQNASVSTTFSLESKPFAGGDGTEENPYLVATPKQFDNIRYFIYHRDENGEFDYSTPNYFLQIEDLNFSLHDFNGDAPGNIDPIGTLENGFAGVYDGGQYSIEYVEISSSADSVGLFASTTSSAKIYNIGLKNSSISSTGTGTVGGLVGENHGTIKYVYNASAVNGASGYVGGLVGENYGSVLSSYNSGNVSGTQTGGVVGYNAGTLESSYNSGELGTEKGGLIHTYASGTVSRLVYLNTTATSAIYSGGASVEQSTIISATQNQLASREKITIGGAQNYVVALLNNLNSSELSAFFYNYNSSYTYPQIWINPQDNSFSPRGTGTSSDPYVITSPQLFSLIGKTLEVTELTTISFSNSGNYIQPVDIYFDGVDTNFSNAGTFTPIGLDESSGAVTAFEGSYRGSSASGQVKLTGINIQTAHTNIALFASLASGAVLEGLELSNSSFSTTATSPFLMAGFAAVNNGTISNCVNKANIVFTTQSHHDNGTNAGGIVANNNGTLYLCANLGQVSVYNPNNTTGASTFAAGLAAVNSGRIERSYNAGYINGGQTGGLACISSSGAVITHCFNSGDVDCVFTLWAAGLVCNADGSTLTYCYNVGVSTYGIGVYAPSSQTHVYYLNAVSNQNFFNGNSTDNRITVNQLAGMTPLSGSQYFMDIFNSQGTYWEFDRLYTSMDALPYQFAHLIDNKCQKTYTYAMQISVDNYHLVDNVSKFQAICNSYNNIYYGGDGNYRLTADINYNNSTYTIKGDFSGKLDGGGHTVSNVAEIVSSSYTQLGLFNRIIGNAEIRNITFDNCGVTNNSDNSDASAGVLAGRIGLGVIVENVTINNSFAQGKNNNGGFAGSITSVDSATGGYIRGVALNQVRVFLIREIEPNCPTGGFVGWVNGAQISSCYYANSNTNTGENNTSVYGVWKVGGFVGVVDGNTSISNCFAYGSVYSDRRTSSAGNDNRDSVGGFVGVNNSSSATISNCYANVILSGYGDRYSLDSTKRLYYRSRGFGRNEGGGTFTNNYCFSGSRGLDNAGATELSDSQLKTQSSFSGWDFTNTWTMSSTGAVPYGMPIPRATQGQTVSNGTISVTTDGNVTAQAYKDGALVGTVTSTSSGNLQFVQLPMGSYTIVLHRNGQTLSNSSNYLSAADRGLEILNVTISSSSPNASLSSTRYFSSGAGTEGNPYVISTLEEFLNLEKFAGQGESTFFILNSNIEAGGQELSSGISNFMGTLDGNGKQLQNFKITKQSGNLGVFETLTNATIKNLGIVNFILTNNDSSGAYTGALAGQMTGSQIVSSYAANGFLNVNSNSGSLVGYMSGSSITYSYATNNITSLITDNQSASSNLGGFVSFATGASTISECYSDGNVTGTKRLGGFIATADNVSIENTYTRVSLTTNYNGSLPSEVGGFAGYVSSSSSIVNSFMYGFVTDSTNSNSSATGSFIGVNNSSSITNCYVWEINVFEAIAQNTTDVSVTKLSTLEFSQASSFGNFDFVDVWGMPSVDSQVSGAPILRNVVNAFEINETILGSGTQFDPYIIFDEETLMQIIEYQQNYSGTGKVYFKLQKDIDLSSGAWTGLGSASLPFTGVLDGNGKTISGLNFSSSSATGLFNYTNGATISNLILSDISVSSTGQEGAGALVGQATDTIFENVTITQSNVTSAGAAGALVGSASGGVVYKVNVSSSTVNSQTSAGGLVGQATNIEIANNEVSGLTIVSSSNAGGIAGLSNGGQIVMTRSTNNSISGANVGGVVGSGVGAYINSVSVSNISVPSATYFGMVAGQATQNTSIVAANILLSNSVSASTAAGAIVGYGQSSIITLCNVNSYWEAASGSISSMFVGGIIGQADGMTEISDNRIAKLNLTSTQAAGAIGQIYGSSSGSTISSTLYREISVSNSAGATFNNMTGTEVSESSDVATITITWTLVS